MRFLADESCDFAAVRALRTAGHDFVTVRDVKPRATDEAVIGLALGESRALLTEDKDFGQLVFASAVESPGVVFIRFPVSARQTMARIVVELVGASAEKITGHFVVVQPGRIRISERTVEK
ncbi:MAG: DUF5615 family PIN-like protein [bacterium]|uniref:DUF5615 family PIN-like protein n=1 Tax=Candidatus Methylomirabilis tolerans TaxID=3123416 RepID=A0AAJ1ALQ9_9BACT|nr:DUF5615 family PIN-like protein [Candidatus Methylomirabilis sp.]